MQEYDFKAIAKKFKLEGEMTSCERFGEGHINDTFLLKTEDDDENIHKYILQRINGTLFTNVKQLMSNISLVTEFNRKKVLARGGNPDREGITVIPTITNQPYYFDGAHYFRVYIFIDDATCFQVVKNPSDFYEAAVGFGNFANLLAEFDAKQLFEVLPNFHNTVMRYDNFLKAIEENKAGRADSIPEEIAWVKAHEEIKSIIVSKLASGEIPLRVTHNDTKFNNVMIDNTSGKAIAVIDLDTIMPGSLCYDFGDSIRFGCNPCAEDEPNLSIVNFSVSLFKEFTRGYLSAVGASITNAEKQNLVNGAIVMTYECGTRFLTDYLNGDTYFKTHRPGQNLDRARTQFKLVNDMIELYDELMSIVNQG